MKTVPVCAAVILFVSLIGNAVAEPTPPRYGVTVLGPLGPQDFPVALNNNRQFASYYSFDHPVPEYVLDHFVDYNDKAESLGWSYRDCCDLTTRHYYRGSSTGRTWLDGMYEANALNDQSVIAGSVPFNAGQRAVLYDGQQYRDMGTLGGASSSATDVNNAGDVIGWSETANGEVHPFLYRDGVMQDLSTLPGWIGSPVAINDHGQMVVTYRDPTLVEHIFFYSNGVMQEIIAPGPRYFFTDLNNLGQVLLYRPEAGSGMESILWQGGQSYELLSLVDPSAHYFFHPAVDMNDKGDILLRGCRRNYFDDCFALALQPVPEPETWTMLVAGVILLLRLRQRQGGA